MTLNQILLIGRAGNDPEMRYTENATAVTNFSLAVNNRRRDENGDWVEDTEWFRVTAWERQAESVNQYLSKGSRVFVDGRFSTSQYTNNSGEARISLEVRAFKVIFLDSASPSMVDEVVVDAVGEYISESGTPDDDGGGPLGIPSQNPVQF